MNPNTTRRVLTGATGFVGSHFLWRWLGTGSPVRALVRAPTEAQAAARSRQALLQVAKAIDSNGSDVPRIAEASVLCADVQEEHCALSERARLLLRRSSVDEFWHFAASLKYEARHRTSIFQSNVEGTLNALRLARDIGSQWFVYVSTAYTAGRQRGLVRETLHEPEAGFNNCYEESKSRAEHEVASFCEAHGMRYAILRPSIVIGPFSSKSTGGSTTGLYGFAREILRRRGPLRALGRPAEICGEGETLCNLMPVDWFVDDVASLLDEGMDSGAVYHHTCERSLTIREIGEILANVLDLPGFAIQPVPSPNRSLLESAIEKKTAFYGGYLSNSKLFERARPFPSRLSARDLSDYLREYVRESGAEPALREASADLIRPQVDEREFASESSTAASQRLGPE